MNTELISKLKSMNPTEGEWDDSYGVIESNDVALFDRRSATQDDCTLITLAPSMREELLRMEEAYNIVKELAEWSDEWNNGNKSLTECIDKLEEIDEKAKQFIKTTQHP